MSETLEMDSLVQDKEQRTNTQHSGKRIQKLSSELANQIAAGEVVERPASVLKELLENSLDAGSTQIDITLLRGGIGLIRVQDNGHGICKEDLALALSQHATSKITSLSELEEVRSFGFRGEALASIASVSRLSLQSWVEGQTEGYKIQKTGRDLNLSLMKVAPIPGTCIEVRDLFYNTPARRKFLRSEKTELLHLEELFKKIALSSPSVAFSLWEGERLKKSLPACRSQEAETRRLSLLCGQNFVKESHYIEAESNGLKLKGWLASRNQCRATTDLQYFYVNGRIVRDKVVTHAIRQAYQGLCPEGRYPSFVLYFELAPESVDVNVHPTKNEVRFREARTVHAFLSYSIREGLAKAGELVPLSKETSDFSFDFARVNFQHSRKTQLPTFSFGKPLSILEGELLLTENKEGWIIVDIKAARKFITRQVLKESYEAGMILKRPLLLPESLVISEAALKNLEGSILNWERLGFELTQSGENYLLVRALPFVFKETPASFKAFIQAILCCKEATQVIELISKEVCNFKISLEDATQLLQDLEKINKNKKEELTYFYRQVSSEALRLFLF